MARNIAAVPLKIRVVHMVLRPSLVLYIDVVNTVGLSGAVVLSFYYILRFA
jgi:hypothetical protein